jgi:uncharacterized protein YidB (DUF937 family)
MDILNGMQNGPRGQTEPGKGGMSPITMAMLALLAYKAYNKMSAPQTGSAPQPQPHMPPAANDGGGLGGLLGGLLGGGGASPAGGNLGGLANMLPGGLGGLLAGGAAGGLLSGGLNDLLNQLSQGGHGDVAKSWVGTGPNKAISPSELGDALGDDTVNSLAEQAGLSKVELLNGLSQQMPQLVDQLTPQGRVPDEHEMSRMI